MQTGSDDLPFRSAFKNVIFRGSWNLDVEKPLAEIQNQLNQEGNFVLLIYKYLHLFDLIVLEMRAISEHLLCRHM